MTTQIKTLKDFINAEKVIAEKTAEYVNRVGWKQAEAVLSEALECFTDAKEEIFQILEEENFDRWYQMGVLLNARNYALYSVLGIEEQAAAIKQAYNNKDLLREVFDFKVADYKECMSHLDAIA